MLNLAGQPLDDDQIDVLKLGLRYGLATRPNHLEIMSFAEDVWNQVSRLDMFKEGRHVQDKVKNSLRCFAYNYIDLDLEECSLDRRRIRILRNLNANFAIHKPDKGKCIVLMKRSGYVTSVRSLFTDSSKFKKVLSDPTPPRPLLLQKYLSTLLKRSEITQNEYNALRPKATHFGRVHGLPKIHKAFSFLPKFRPITDTVNAPYYNIGKFISSQLNPLTLNEFSLSDSFDVLSSSKNIPEHLFLEGYQFVSFDIESLFTNVPFTRTVNIVLNRIYNKNVINTTFSKYTLKTLILNCCSKTTVPSHLTTNYLNKLTVSQWDVHLALF